MNERERKIRAVRFDTPNHIPVAFSINSACWHHYPQDAIQELMSNHPMLFPNFEWTQDPIVPDYAPWQKKDKAYTDSWECVWRTPDDGITGAVVEHPLEDWDDFVDYAPPSPEGERGWGIRDWDADRDRIIESPAKGKLAIGSLRHGHTFLTLQYIRGYENLIYDMADENPRLLDLIDMVETFNMGLVNKLMDAGIEWMGYPEDLGMQIGPMLSPDHFRRFIKPSYQRLVSPAREKGCILHMHSDGDIRDLCEDILDVGMDVLNLQDLVNGLDWIEANLKNKACIDLDIDRQSVTRFGTPEHIDDHIRTWVERLGSPQGRLS